MKHLASAVLALCVCVAPSMVLAKIYKWTDDHGQVHFSQTRPGEASPNLTVVKERNSTRIHLSGEEQQQYCDLVRKIAAKGAEYMLRGYTLDGMYATQTADATDALVKSVMSSVWRYRGTESGAADIGRLVYNQCQNGAFDRHVEEFWQQRYPDQPLPGTESRMAFGTGWSAGEYIITSHHVVDGFSKISIVLESGDKLPATVAKVDREHDLALLRVEHGSQHLRPLPIAGQLAPLGADVITIGYPHVDLMGRAPKVTKGIISAHSGMRDDPLFYQISVPVQSGNSGGPLINQHGEVVGVIAAKLNADSVLRSRGDLTQNVNYAVKSSYVLGLLQAEPGGSEDSQPPLETTEVVARVQASVVMVVAEQPSRNP